MSFQSTSSAWRTTIKSYFFYIFRHNFNPRPPHGGRLLVTLYRLHFWFYFNPRPPHGGRHGYILYDMFVFIISIHVLRMEDDSYKAAKLEPIKKFQSTSSAWRTTAGYISRAAVNNYFNPRPPHGGRLVAIDTHAEFSYISIHVLRMEDD